MPKKISGNKPVNPIKTEKLSQSQSVKTVSGVKEVKETAKTNRAKGATRMISAQEKSKLLKMVEDEAEKLFGKNGLPEEKRKKVEEAVKMTIDAALETEEE